MGRVFLIYNTMSDKQYFTKEGFEKFKNELSHLKTKGRSEMARQIAEARDKGDLSENAEYDAAKEAQGHLEAKISQMETVLGNARVLDESQIDTSKVQVLSKVTIMNKKVKKKMTYQIVAESEANVREGKISVTSPIGKGLLGKVVGQSAIISTPNGNIELEVLEISI